MPARDGKLLALKATGQGRDGPIVRTASPLEEIYLPGGGRGHFPVQTLALAVTDPSDITVAGDPARGGARAGRVAGARCDRDPETRGSEQGVNLAVVLQHLGGIHGNPLPPGVKVKEAGSKTLLGPKETKGKIIIEAAATAPPCRKGADHRHGPCVDQLRREDRRIAADRFWSPSDPRGWRRRAEERARVGAAGLPIATIPW